MGYGVVNVLVLRESRAVAALHMLLVFGKPFKPVVLRIRVLYLACYYVDLLVVILIHRACLGLALLHGSKLLLCRRVVRNFVFAEFNIALHNFIAS